MKMCIVVPITSLSRKDLDKRIEYLNSYKNENTQLVMWEVNRGPATIESRYEEELAAQPVLELVQKAYKQGFDAIGVWCGCDPAVFAAREMVNIPVVGPGESALSLAYLLGRRYSILATRKEDISIFEELVERTGYAKRLASIKETGLTVLELRKDASHTLDRLITAGRQCIEKDRAQVLVMGCLGMFGFADQVKKVLNIPVIDPALAMVGIAEFLTRGELSFSKLAYPTPGNFK